MRGAYLLKAAELPTLSGALYFLAYIGFGIWPLVFVCFLPLLWSLRDATPRQALGLGAWMGFVAHLGGYTWIVRLLRVFAFMSWPVAFLGYLLLCAAQGVLFGVFALALRWAWTLTRWRLAALLPLALCATEYTYPLLFQSYTGAALLPLAGNILATSISLTPPCIGVVTTISLLSLVGFGAGMVILPYLYLIGSVLLLVNLVFLVQRFSPDVLD